MAEAQGKENVTVVADLQSSGTVLGSPVSIGVVTLNLVSNALLALPPGGTVRVSTRSTEEEVRLVVEDDGHGIPAELLPRIWDPFFTTRGAGEGLGLGLSLVHRIVHDDMGGRIDVQSSPGKGTRFEVVIPRVADAREDNAWSDLTRSDLGPS